MTGGVGFSRMGSQSSKANRQMLKDVKGKHFKNTGTYKNVKIKEVKADPVYLSKIKKERQKVKHRNTIVYGILIVFTALLIAFIAYTII